jgi:hypothetical protein
MPRPLYPRERAPGTHWIGGWSGPRAGLDAVSKRKIPIPRRDSNPDYPIVQAVVSRYTDWAIPASYVRLSHTKILNVSSTLTDASVGKLAREVHLRKRRISIPVSMYAWQPNEDSAALRW